jgi:hypothetical protein
MRLTRGDLLPHGLDFQAQRLVFLPLSRQKGACQPRPFGHARAGQHIGIAALVLGLREIAELDQPLSRSTLST